MRPSGRAALALTALLALAGCRTLAPALAPLPADDPRPAARLRELLDLAAQRSSLRAKARVSIEGQRRASFAQQLLLLERPARMRLEVLGVLGQRVAVLATDGAHYDLYRAERPGIETGDVHPGILWEVAGLALTPEETVRLALGAPLSAEEQPSVAESAALPDGGLRIELGYRAGDVRRTLEFDAGAALTRYAVRDAAGTLVLDAHYGDYRDAGGSRFAHEIAVELPAVESRAEIRFQWVELNPALEASLFRLPQRSGARGAPWRPGAS